MTIVFLVCGLHLVAMENIYDIGQRTWVSEKIHLKDYFSEFASSLPEVDGNDGNYKNYQEANKAKLSKLMDVSLSDKEFSIVENTCSILKLDVADEPQKVDVRCMKMRPGLYDVPKIPSSAGHLETIKNLVKRNTSEENVGNLKYRSNIWPKIEQDQKTDLEVGKHILLTVRVYHPFRHRLGVRNSNPPRCSQEMIVLGNQTMDVLRDRVICPSDLAVPGELSENPDQVFKERAKDKYKSGFIYIEGTFYNDFRDPENIDYSQVIRKWGEDHFMGPFNTARMELCKFEDLSLRLGYPYVYQHQGNCEHLIVFSDARLLHESDPLSSENYPSIRSLSSTNAQYCMICGLYVARWITCENERVPHDPCYFCEGCFRSYNYIDGKKIGNFKAFPFFGKP